MDRCLSVLSVMLVYCDQTVRWIKIKLGMQVGLSPGHIALDGDPAPFPRWAHPPIFGPYLLWPNGWMDQDATCGLGPSDIVLDGDPALLPKKVVEPPNFRPMCIVTKRLDGSRCHLVWR